VQGEGGALSDRPDPPNMLPAIVPTAAGQPVDVFEVYRNNVGMVTPLIAEALRDAETSDGAEWVCAAIAEAVQNNVRSWKYIAAILSRWRQDGFRSGVSPQELGNRSRRGGGISNDQIQAFMEAGKKGSDP
jgi:DNA replication protein